MIGNARVIGAIGNARVGAPGAEMEAVVARITEMPGPFAGLLAQFENAGVFDERRLGQRVDLRAQVDLRLDDRQGVNLDRGISGDLQRRMRARRLRGYSGARRVAGFFGRCDWVIGALARPDSPRR